MSKKLHDLPYVNGRFPTDVLYFGSDEPLVVGRTMMGSSGSVLFIKRQVEEEEVVKYAIAHNLGDVFMARNYYYEVTTD